MSEINIVVIEDNQDTALIIEKTLNDVGYKAWIVTEPKEGLDLLRNIPVAVLITEMRSGKMNGLEVAMYVQKISPQTNVIVITLYSFIQSAIEAMEMGAYGYITKPLNTSEIRIVLERAIERYILLSSNAEKDYYAELAIRDGLTGVYNRRYFMEIMFMEFARLKRQPTMLSLLMIDLDDFKNYNDTRGHPAGDELLKKAAGIFKSSLRESDAVCRYGGEEFVVLLPLADKKNAQIIAERIREQFRLYLETTISIGVATFPVDANDSQTLLENADKALYKAKQTGKNKVCSA